MLLSLTLPYSLLLLTSSCSPSSPLSSPLSFLFSALSLSFASSPSPPHLPVSSIHAYILSDDCGELIEEQWDGDEETEEVLVDKREGIFEHPDLTSTPLHQATLNSLNITPFANIPHHLETHGKESMQVMCVRVCVYATVAVTNITVNDLTSDIWCMFHASLDVVISQPPAVEMTMPRSQQKRDTLARSLFHEFNSKVFENKVGCAHT